MEGLEYGWGCGWAPSIFFYWIGIVIACWVFFGGHGGGESRERDGKREGKMGNIEIR